MTWNRRTSAAGNPNGYQARFGPISIEVFQDFATKDWVMKIPEFSIREIIADAAVGQVEVLLDLAEREAIYRISNLRGTATLAINALKKKRGYPN